MRFSIRSILIATTLLAVLLALLPAAYTRWPDVVVSLTVGWIVTFTIAAAARIRTSFEIPGKVAAILLWTFGVVAALIGYSATPSALAYFAGTALGLPTAFWGDRLLEWALTQAGVENTD